MKKEYIRLAATDPDARRARVFLDGIEVTGDCFMVDTALGEVGLYSRPLRVVEGRVHKYHTWGKVRVEIDGKVYESCNEKERP